MFFFCANSQKNTNYKKQENKTKKKQKKGGTWSEYPHEYQEEFLRDCFYSANTFFDKNKRTRKTLFEEQKINESTQCRIIGVTLETRPDSIDFNELKRLRNYGCTRMQIGIQHTDNEILKKINRG